MSMLQVKAVQLPDNIPILQELVTKGLIIPTPPQDYDDSYCIVYAKQHNGYIVTNDMYRDHVKKMDVHLRDDERNW